MISGHLFCHPQRFKQGGIGLPFTQNTPPSIGVFAFDLLLFIFSYFTGQKQKSISEINLVDQIKYFLLLLILLPPPPPLPPTRQNIVMTLSTLVCCHGCNVGTSFCVLILISHIIIIILVYYFIWFASSWYLFDSRGGFCNKINCSSYCCQVLS